jgi:hypothetical protein
VYAWAATPLARMEPPATIWAYFILVECMNELEVQYLIHDAYIMVFCFDEKWANPSCIYTVRICGSLRGLTRH